jgi:hypothetical protein
MSWREREINKPILKRRAGKQSKDESCCCVLQHGLLSTRALGYFLLRPLQKAPSGGMPNVTTPAEMICLGYAHTRKWREREREREKVREREYRERERKRGREREKEKEREREKETARMRNVQNRKRCEQEKEEREQ